MIRSLFVLTITILSLFIVAGCGDDAADGPPVVHLGEDVCAECGMIISDERFAAATIIEDERGGATSLLFDDFNCQINHEMNHRETVIFNRWAHDHSTMEWLPATDAVYVRAPDLRTPMASHIAAFAKQADAEALQTDLGGDILNFEAMRDIVSGGRSSAKSP